LYDEQAQLGRQLLIHWVHTYLDSVGNLPSKAKINGAFEALTWLCEFPGKTNSFVTASDEEWEEVRQSGRRRRIEGQVESGNEGSHRPE
jgi:hypothetical protein